MRQHLRIVLHMSSLAPVAQPIGGIFVYFQDANDRTTLRDSLLAYLDLRDVAQCSTIHTDDERGLRVVLQPEHANTWAPDYDTGAISKALGLDIETRADDLEREILIALLMAPITFEFPSVEELVSSVRIRRNVAQAARRTALAFDTVSAERPEGYWTYSKASGFTVLPGKSLVEALTLATQPATSGKLYAFSCYRATEYVTLLGIARELTETNPALMGALQRQWENQAIMSGLFHDVFLREYGTMEQPLPPKFYVPGDRLWFRNPDEFSSNVEGYEGSWVIYLGQGLFTNFWKREQPFTLTSKCVELYHWRNATRTRPDGTLFVDDACVDRLVAQSMADPQQVAEILAVMLKLREPQGVYRNGGCIDTSRECARWVRPGTADIKFPLNENAPIAN
jgi:hypothetical protein